MVFGEINIKWVRPIIGWADILADILTHTDISVSAKAIFGQYLGMISATISALRKYRYRYRLNPYRSIPTLDVIEAVEVSKIYAWKDKFRYKDTVLDICGNRYWKINKDKSTRFTSILVSNGGVYSRNKIKSKYYPQSRCRFLKNWKSQILMF